jgi:malonate-semialdehyde dehydrogenase (acetylating)/methylmalonate-semialdehyde dehydrogenase
MAKLEPKVRALKIGPGADPEAEMGPLVTKQHYEKVRGYIDAGEREGAKLVVDGRGFKMQGYENGYFIGGALFDHVTTDMKILPGRDLRAGLSRCARPQLRSRGSNDQRS